MTTIQSHCESTAKSPASHPSLNLFAKVLNSSANFPNSSPQGRIFQVEYAQEAVKQGSVVVGLVSKTHAVLVALKVTRASIQRLHEKMLTFLHSGMPKSYRRTRKRL